MKKHKYLLFLTVILCILSLMLTGCKGFKTSFIKPHFGESVRQNVGDIICDVISEKSKMSINEAELDFYYGYIKDESLKAAEEEFTYLDNDCIEHNLSFVSFTLYFMKKDNRHMAYQMPEYEDDYKNIQDTMYIKEIAYDDFYSDTYKVFLGNGTSLGSRKLTYKHNETIKVDPEVFARDKNNFVFCICAIYYNEALNKYAIMLMTNLTIYYKYLNSHTVKLVLEELDLNK